MPQKPGAKTNAAPKKGINKRKLMNSMVNIPSTNPDPYYRYKMPALEIRINPARVRTNNPQKEAVEIPASTQLQNLTAVARALNRPLEYISKFMELELEMQGVMDDRQRWFKLCGGELTEGELMMILDKFIRRFVLCYVCNNPETALTIYNTNIVKECGACGQSTRVDRFSKLTRFLLRDRHFGMGFAHVVVDPTKCRFLKEDPYKIFEEFIITSRDDMSGASTGTGLPDKDEVLGKFYTLDLEKEGAIFILERLQKRQQEHKEPEEEDQKQETKRVCRDDYEEMIQVLRDSLEREVIVAGTLDESSSGLSSSDSDDEDDDDSEADA
ncbi:hypothetical protein BGZ98_006054 [Dissophora globulifera]|nr:hypothetical protein BGZ98_006054 [Dissophora globulifera]